MTFETTQDMELVERILKDPRCYVRMRNDEAPSLRDFSVVGGGFIAVVGKDGGRALAVFLLFPEGDSAEVHFCILPEVWGKSKQMAEGFLSWAWSNTEYQRLVGPVPAYNKLCLELARSVGFHEVGREERAVAKHGKLYDRIWTEVTR